MLLKLEKTSEKIQKNFSEEVYELGFNSWFAKAHQFLNKGSQKTVDIQRKDWSSYIIQKLETAQERVLFHVDWPLVPQEMRTQVLSILQGCLLEGIYVDACFRSPQTIPGGWPLFLRLENGQNTNKISARAYAHKDHFSFMIIDQMLILQAPSKQYHQHLKFFEISNVPEGKIKNIFENFFM